MEQPVVNIYLPTYRMEPEEDEKFYPSQAKAIAERVIDATLKDQVYHEEDAKDWSVVISDQIREQITSTLKLPRFKIVVQTVIGQMRDQGIRIASRCLWDTSTDNYASVQYKNAISAPQNRARFQDTPTPLDMYMSLITKS